MTSADPPRRGGPEAEPPSAATAWHGDADLVAAAQRLVSRRHPVVAVAAVTPRASSIAGRGGQPAADFEIGSISKGVTGLLYRDARERGLVQATTTLGELLPLTGTTAAGVTLRAISTHRSGLPGLPRAARPVRRTAQLLWHGTNPYGETLDDLIAQAHTVRLGRPTPRYSNFGFELLGHALARAAGTGYADLVGDRISEPLGLTTFYVPARDEDLRPTALIGRTRHGRPRDPWTGEALGPAGGIRAAIADMATLTRALLDGTVPGTSALDPVEAMGARLRIGAAWMTLEHRGRTITWHNGGTGGFRSWLGLDREAGAGAVVLSATSRSVDAVGFRLLERLVEAEGARPLP